MIRATKTSSQAAARRRSFQANRARRIAIGPRLTAATRRRFDERTEACLTDSLSTVCRTPFHARKESAMDIGLPETEREIEVTPLEEPVPAPAPVEEPQEEPVPA